jgi:hypothetical protein
MRTAPFLLAASLLAACIKPIPVPCVDATDCDVAAAGACIAAAGAAWCAYADPSCPGSLQRYASDVGDALAGTCVPLVESCEPGEFQACAGGQLTRCNATGTATETILCELGCSEALAGCRLCEASTTACTNGTVATCDADGRPTATRECPLGCFADEPRCREIVPSNGLGPALDSAATRADVVIPDGSTFDVATGRLQTPDGTTTMVKLEMLRAERDGAPIRAWAARSFRIGDLSFAPGRDLPAIAFVADENITVTGHLDVSGIHGQAPGAVTTSTCAGMPGYFTRYDSKDLYPGSGGAGYATAGGNGGSSDLPFLPSQGGQPFANEDLVPLRGGCDAVDGGRGGGAIQLVARREVVLLEGAVINANGRGGDTLLGGISWVTGGGSGGAILIEAPSVTLEAGSALVANGGGGGSAGAAGSPGLVSAEPGPVAPCTSSCAPGGAGGTRSQPAQPGGSTGRPGNQPGPIVIDGAGGGSVGYIRVNTASGAYRRATDAIESPAPTTGRLATR